MPDIVEPVLVVPLKEARVLDTVVRPVMLAFIILVGVIVAVLLGENGVPSAPGDSGNAGKESLEMLTLVELP